jgi:hypothetical protein
MEGECQVITRINSNSQYDFYSSTDLPSGTMSPITQIKKKNRIISKKWGSHKTAMPNTPRKSKEWLFFPYLAGLKNSYPEILRRYEKSAKSVQSVDNVFSY